MATENARVDTTFIGYLLIGALLLMLGVLGLEHGGLFGELKVGDDGYTSLPLDFIVSSTFCGIIGVALIVLSIYEYRIGNKSAAAVFTMFSVGIVSYALLSVGRILHLINGTKIGEYLVYALPSMSWFILIVITVFFFVMALYLFLDKAPIFVGILAIIAALIFLFMGLMYYFIAAEGLNADITKAMGIVFGAFAFIGFVLATYVGIAYSIPRAKLPVL